MRARWAEYSGRALRQAVLLVLSLPVWALGVMQAVWATQRIDGTVDRQTYDLELYEPLRPHLEGVETVDVLMNLMARGNRATRKKDFKDPLLRGRSFRVQYVLFPASTHKLQSLEEAVERARAAESGYHLVRDPSANASLPRLLGALREVAQERGATLEHVELPGGVTLIEIEP